jgi:hypothetical protein
VSVTNPRWMERRLPKFFVDWCNQWEGRSSADFTLSDYINHQQGLTLVVAAGWIFCPATIEYRGGLFLVDRFNQKNVDQWLAQFDGDVGRTEVMVNQTKLYDLFGSQDIEGHDTDLSQLSEAIGECWQGVLSARYPDLDIVVEISGEEDGSYGPTVTFWSAHSK